MTLRLGDRLVEALEAVDLGDADRRTGARGLDEQRPAVLTGEVDDLLAGRGGVELPLAGADHLVRTDGQSEGDEDPLHVLLVLAHRGGEDTSADVGDTGEFEQSLEGAVLTVGAVQHREDDVDLAECLGHGAGFAVHDLAVRRVDGEHDAALGRLGQLLHARRPAIGDRHAVGLVGGERPPAVRGDADGQYVVLRPVDGPQHGSGGDHGDPVFGAAAAEDDSHTRLAERLLRALGEVLGAHIALRLPCAPGAVECRHSACRVSGARASRCATSAP